MKTAARIVFSSLVGVMLVAAAWATTPQPAATQTAAQSEQTQSVSGKIVSFDKTSLTLAVAASNTASQTADQTAKPKSMTKIRPVFSRMTFCGFRSR